MKIHEIRDALNELHERQCKTDEAIKLLTENINELRGQLGLNREECVPTPVNIASYDGAAKLTNRY